MKRIICHSLITGAMISISLCFIGGLTKLESRQAMALVNYGVKVSVLSPKKSTRPKSLITHVFSVVNQGQKEDTYELKVKVPEGWMVVTEPGSITLSPGEERPVFVSVSLPSSVPAGKYWIQFTATSQADPSVFASAKASVKVTEVYGVKVKVLTLERPARAGQATDYLFRITNLGNVSDRFQISVTSLHKWAIDLTKEKVKLRPGQEVELIASLTIPGEVELTRDYLTFKVFSKKASDTKRIIIKVFPIPRKALGTIYRQVPAVLTLRSIGSLPPGSLKTQVGFTTGGTLKDDRWFALKLSSSNQTTFSLVNLTSTLKDVIDWRFSFDQFQYGWSWGDITLGNISLNLPSLKDKIAGRGVKFRVQTGSSQFAVYTAWDRLQIGLDMALPPFKKDPLEASLRIDSLIKEGVTNIGGMLTAEIDDMKAEALNLNWTSISRVNYQKGKSDEEIGVDQKLVGMLKDSQANALTLSYKYQNGGITNKLGQGVLDLKADQNLGFLSLSEKIGISSKGSQLDKLAQLSSLLDFDKLTFYTEYHYIGPNFPVKGKDKQGYELAAQAKFPNFSLSANLNYDHNNLAQDPDQAIIVKRMFQLTTGVNLTHIPPLRGKLEWSREESVKVPPGVDPTDKWMVLTSLDLYESIGSVSYLSHGRWKKEVDKIAGTELDLTSYRSLVTWRMKRAWIWSTVVGGSEWDVKAKEGTSWFGGSAGLGYRLARRLWGWVSLGLGRRGSILSFGLDYRLPDDTNLALMVRRRYTDVSGVSWSGRLWFRKWIEFKLPIPWIKVRGRIKGRIFNDKNGNGKLDSGERGIPEVVLWADNIQAISDSNGKFAFPAMEPGDYKIRLANVSPDYVAGMAFPKRVSLTAGKIAKLEIPLSEPGMISGFVFDDQNKNGIRDKGEAGVAGVGVTILRENFPSRARYTPQNGHFSFARVVAGEYKVILDKRTLPSAFHLTTPVKYAVTLPPGEERTVNFGIYKEVVMKRMPPTAEFTWNPVEPTTKDEVQFTDWSMVIEGKIISWEWDFGDGTTSTGKNPIHQYSKPGTYKVTLTITDDAGLTDGVTYQIEVSAPE